MIEPPKRVTGLLIESFSSQLQASASLKGVCLPAAGKQTEPHEKAQRSKSDGVG